MAHRSIRLSDPLYDYLLKVSLRESALQQRLREETQQQEWAVMQISPEQGQFMYLLAKLLGVRRALEIGVYTGYSSLCVAQALPVDGELIACDISASWTAIAQRYWQAAGLQDRIQLQLAPALETLQKLLAAGRAGQFDWAFIDADKVNYSHYYEACLTLLRPGGVILVDNVLWNGAVIDAQKNDPDTVAIRQFNDLLAHDRRVEISMLPIGDGLSLARKCGG